MKGQTEILKFLNEVLCQELTAINQYFLHARMLQNWGLTELGEKEYKASIDEMKHADQVIKRILFLEGVPNVQKIGKVDIGQDVPELLKADLGLENRAIPILKDAIKKAETSRDFVSRELFLSILKSEEEHVDWLETQLELVKKVGLQNYLQSQME